MINLQNSLNIGVCCVCYGAILGGSTVARRCSQALIDAIVAIFEDFDLFLDDVHALCEGIFCVKTILSFAGAVSYSFI